MKDFIIGAISDTHDHLTNVAKAIDVFRQNHADMVIHCGDYVAPFTLQTFKDLSVPLVGVIGNCDGEIDLLLKTAHGLNFSLYYPPHTLLINNRKIIITHKPITLNEPYAIYLYGHTHRAEVTYKDNTLIVNPGEACGWLFGKPTIALLNLDKIQAEIIDL
ncbi:MAG: metallophosphoesterase [candidate division WOR-3 bacterium]